MDSIINFVRNLDLTAESLGTVAIIGGVFVFVILWLIITSILKFTTYVTSKKKIKYTHMLLPALLSTVFNVLLITVLALILIKKDINPFYELLKFMLDLTYDSNKLKIIILGFSASQLVFMLVETFILKLVDLHPLYYKRLGILKLFKKTEKIDKLRERKPEKYNLSILNCILSSLLSFTLVAVFCIGCLLLGKYLGATYFLDFEL